MNYTTPPKQTPLARPFNTTLDIVAIADQLLLPILDQLRDLAQQLSAPIRLLNQMSTRRKYEIRMNGLFAIATTIQNR